MTLGRVSAVAFRVTTTYIAERSMEMEHAPES